MAETTTDELAREQRRQDRVTFVDEKWSHLERGDAYAPPADRAPLPDDELVHDLIAALKPSTRMYPDTYAWIIADAFDRERPSRQRIARELAEADGHDWKLCSPERHRRYFTLAETVLSSFARGSETSGVRVDTDELEDVILSVFSAHGLSLTPGDLESMAVGIAADTQRYLTTEAIEAAEATSNLPQQSADNRKQGTNHG